MTSLDLRYAVSNRSPRGHVRDEACSSLDTAYEQLTTAITASQTDGSSSEQVMVTIVTIVGWFEMGESLCSLKLRIYIPCRLPTPSNIG